MTVANVNVVFGEQEEPMVYHIDDIIIPALTSGIFRESGKKTRFLFNDVSLRHFSGEYVICGLLIKDTILEIQSEYDDEVGLIETDKSMQSAPYSLFMIYLKNHRMVLVKNQKGSPDIRSFKSTFSAVYILSTFSYLTIVLPLGYWLMRFLIFVVLPNLNRLGPI